MGGQAMVAFALLLPVALAGCMSDHTRCTAYETPPSDEPPQADYNLCGTVFRWNGEQDRLEVVEAAPPGHLWANWTLVYGEPPNSDHAVLGMAFGVPASEASYHVNHGVTPLSEVAKGSLLPGQFVSLCMKNWPWTGPFWLGLSIEAPGYWGGMSIPTHLERCT